MAGGVHEEVLFNILFYFSSALFHGMVSYPF